MKITWVSISPKEEGCLLGDVCVGGIVTLGKYQSSGPTFYNVDCALPSCNVPVKEFATLQEIKDSFEKAISEWIESAGLG